MKISLTVRVFYPPYSTAQSLIIDFALLLTVVKRLTFAILVCSDLSYELSKNGSFVRKPQKVSSRSLITCTKTYT